MESAEEAGLGRWWIRMIKPTKEADLGTVGLYSPTIPVTPAACTRRPRPLAAPANLCQPTCHPYKPRQPAPPALAVAHQPAPSASTVNEDVATIVRIRPPSFLWMAPVADSDSDFRGKPDHAYGIWV